MPTLITTAGSATANSYASIAESDSYHSTMLNSEKWFSSSQTKKEQSLIMATRMLDNMTTWKGVPSSTSQALQWPRRGVLTRVSANAGGVLFQQQKIRIYGGLLSPLGEELASDAIPQFLKDATSEFARSLLASDRIDEQDSGNISSIEIPGLTIGYLGSGSSSKRKLIPPQVYEMIAFYIETMMGYTTRHIIRS